MKILLTHHAQERMEIRGITEEMVKKTLSKTDEKGKGTKIEILPFALFLKVGLRLFIK